MLGAWFLFDISFYGNSLFNASIMALLNFSGDALQQTVLFSLVISAIGLPGYGIKYNTFSSVRYFMSIIFADRLGRKNIQMLGFCMMTIIFTVMGAGFQKLSTDLPILFIALYGATFFFSNFGPNVTTYTITAELFPNEIAATCFGISAAFGKVGALLGTALFDVIKTKAGIPAVFGVCAGLSGLGLILTVIVTQDTRQNREERNPSASQTTSSPSEPSGLGTDEVGSPDSK
jgi:PHS family inorganic phosphate transporter-like MFS transporter